MTAEHCIDFHTLKNNQVVEVYSGFLKPDLHPLTLRSSREQRDSVVLRKGGHINLTGRFDI